MTPPPLPSRPVAPVRNPLTPMLLSAVVYPGAGQLMQRRWAVAGGFIVVFSAAFVWFGLEVYAVLKAYYEFAFDFRHASGEAPGAGSIVLPFAVSTLVYVAGLVDTAVAAHRQRRSAGTVTSSMSPLSRSTTTH